MSRDARLNSYLFAAVICLSLLAWYKPGLNEPGIQLLSDLNPDNIKSIIIKRQDIGQIKLQKHNKHWFIKEPYELPANPLRVNSLLALAQKRIYSSFEIQNTALKKYHLDKPHLTVWLNDRQFVMGSETPINQQRYIMNINDNAASGKTMVHMINGTIFYQFRANLDTFISTRLIPVDSRLTGLEWQGQQLSLNNGRWELKTDKTDISADSVAQLLEFWKHAQALRVETQVNPNISNAELVNKPVVSINLADAQNAQSSINYLVIQQEKQIKLLRTDLKLAYWITPQILKQLTEFMPVTGKKRE
jgi:hypothetical protein